MSLSDAEVALLGTVVGTIGLEVIRRLLDRKDKQADHGAQMRTELREQIADLRDQVASAKQTEQRLEDEVEEWRSKYLDKRDEDIKRQTELMLAESRISSLQGEVDTCKQRLVELEKKILNETDQPKT